MTASPIFACIDKRGGTAGTGTHGHRANSKPVYTAAVLRPALDLFLFFFIPSIFVSFLFYTSLAPTPRAAAGAGRRVAAFRGGNRRCGGDTLSQRAASASVHTSDADERVPARNTPTTGEREKKKKDERKELEAP